MLGLGRSFPCFRVLHQYIHLYLYLYIYSERTSSKGYIHSWGHCSASYAYYVYTCNYV